MKKINKNTSVMILTFVSCLVLIIGSYLAYIGFEARSNEQELLEKINDINKVNKLLQVNYDKLKTKLNNVEKESQSAAQVDFNVVEPKIDYTPSYDDDDLQNFNIMLGTYADYIYPPDLDSESIVALQMYGINSYTLKHAYELKLRTEGYPDEFNTVAELEKIRLIDGNTCIVELSNDEIDLKLIYSLQYHQGSIVFEEIKKTISQQESTAASNFVRKLQGDYIHFFARYKVDNWELLDSQLLLKYSTINYSPNERYAVTLSFQRSYEAGYDDWIPSYNIIVKDIDTNKVIYTDQIHIENGQDIIWLEDSSGFVLENTLFTNMDNIKTIDLDEKFDNGFVLRSVSVSKDYICKVFSRFDDVNMSMSVSIRIYDLHNNYIKDIQGFEQEVTYDQYGNADLYCSLVYDNFFNLGFFATGTGTIDYKIDADKGIAQRIEVYNVLYKYIPELRWKIRQDKDQAGGDHILVIEDYEGIEVNSVRYSKSLINGYIGVDLEQKCLYFSEAEVAYTEDSEIKDFHIIVYNYETQLIEELPLPIDHLGEDELVTGAVAWIRNVSNGVIELDYYIPLK